MGVDGSFSPKSGLQRSRERSPYDESTPREASLEEIQYGVKLIALVRLGFNRGLRSAYLAIDSVDQSSKPGKSCGIGNACTAKEDDFSVFVSSQEFLRNIRAMLDELHRHPPLEARAIAVALQGSTPMAAS